STTRQTISFAASAAAANTAVDIAVVDTAAADTAAVGIAAVGMAVVVVAADTAEIDRKSGGLAEMAVAGRSGLPADRCRAPRDKQLSVRFRSAAHRLQAACHLQGRNSKPRRCKCDYNWGSVSLDQFALEYYDVIIRDVRGCKTSCRVVS